jgi:hypothetical protein
MSGEGCAAGSRGARPFGTGAFLGSVDFRGARLPPGNDRGQLGYLRSIRLRVRLEFMKGIRLIGEQLFQDTEGGVSNLLMEAFAV